MISYKMPVSDLKTVKDYRDMLAESMFLHALNQRLFKISRRKDPPFFACSVAADVLVSPLKAYIMSSSCKEKGTLASLESMLLEVSSAFTLSSFCHCLLPPHSLVLLCLRLLGYAFTGSQTVKYLLFELS